MPRDFDVPTVDERWRALTERWPGHVITLDAENRITSMNRDARTTKVGEALGHDLFDFMPAEIREELFTHLARAREGKSAKAMRAATRDAGGVLRWFDADFVRLRDNHVMIVSRDVTDEETAKAALRFLAEASNDFAEATDDYQRLLTTIARRVSEITGDLCSIRTLSEDGLTLEPGAAYHSDPAIAALALQLLASHRQSIGEGMMGRIALTGQPWFLSSLETATFAAMAPEAYRPLIWRLPVGGVIAVPMQCRSRIVGVVATFRASTGSPYTEHDLQLVQSVADHAALAITNARSYAAEHAARAAAVSANDALQQSEMAHRLLFDASPIPLLVFDTDSLDIIACNDAAARLYGFSRAELLQMKLVDLLVADDRHDVKPAVDSLGDREVVGVVRQRRKDGSPFFAEYASRLLIFQGRRSRFTVITDVTARHEAEEMRALLAAIVQSSNDAILSKRLDGTVTSWNGAAERLYGYAPEEVIGRSVSVVVPDRYAGEEEDLLARVTGGERVERFETVRTRKDGTEVAVSVSLAPILAPSGKVAGVSTTARDLSAQHQAEDALRSTEAQLRQAQKMEAVGRLAGGIAHDFNNILSVILSYSELILTDLKPSHPTRGDVAEIHEAAQRAAELTRQLLVFSRQQVVAPKVVELNDVITSVDTMVRRLVGEDIDLVSSLSDDGGRVCADRGNIEQVILNLVVNARDAMPTGGKLMIETSNVDLSADFAKSHLGASPGPYVMLSVTDTGIGMDHETQERIFEPFFTTKQIGRGTGLGLSTVFGIAQQSGGGVWVESEPRHGTTFRVYFPRVEAPVEPLRKSVPPTSLRGTETILLVEDQEQVRAVAHGILKRNGYRVVEARHAGEALINCESHQGPIHLLLTDVIMPQMSGGELARRVGQMRPELKVLYMSGYPDDNIVRHGILTSETAFLQKPFTPESLTHKVREVLNSESPEDRA